MVISILLFPILIFIEFMVIPQLNIQNLVGIFIIIFLLSILYFQFSTPIHCFVKYRYQHFLFLMNLPVIFINLILLILLVFATDYGNFFFIIILIDGVSISLLFCQLLPMKKFTRTIPFVYITYFLTNTFYISFLIFLFIESRPGV